GTPAAAARGGSLINIQVLGEGGTPAREAPPAERARPAQLDISIQPSTFAPLQEARGHMQEGRRLQAEGRIRQARDAYAAAERLFRFAAQRGGNEAAAARQGLAEAQRALQSARAPKDRNGEERIKTGRSRGERPMPKRGFEPPRPFGHVVLNHARLPFRHFGVVREPPSTRQGGPAKVL